MPSRTLLAALVAIGALLAGIIQMTPDKRTEVLPTPNISQKEAVGTAGYSARFHVPADEVWSKVADFPSYHEWSSSLRVEFQDYPLKAGSVGKLVTTTPGKTPEESPIEILIVDHQARILAWKAILPVSSSLLLVERVQHVVELPDQPGWCEYRSWDSWKGPLGYLVQWTVKKVVKDGVRAWGDQELTKYVNSGAA
ncbi:uncharacterized protein BDZ99DRAFT_461725 [Mytilinidion resinicola]|uniref:Polyketide cyclase/dehydrase n=1 Tax=Mytilinidion resinicola TaxID=574789 RepID=A0A6A6YUL8_9PEZI|nr:uncharacterized protein BDZ99DRAFT_461725 [Mytilinidion resinicola]KAF2811724.1 hypothetical protein BDZ99DRAFT_461725 [Mytilinidion resinicola]